MRMDSISPYIPNTIESIKQLVDYQEADTLDTSKGEGLLSIGEQELINIIERGNKALQGAQTQLQFSHHKESNQLIVKILDSETKEVIKEIPPEKMVDIMYNICELAGIFVNERG